jgi:Subtilase family
MSEGIRVLIQRLIVPEREKSPTLGIDRQDSLFKLAGFSPDIDYKPVQLGSLRDRASAKTSATLDMKHRKKISYLVRGQVDDIVALKKLIEAVEKDKNSIAVFTDPPITTFCESANDLIGHCDDVAEKLLRSTLHDAGMNGTGVYVGIVDTGLNLSHLKDRGLAPNFSSELSSTTNLSLRPGEIPVTESLRHGTMCAFNVCLTATQCTLIDHAVICGGDDNVRSLLSDVIKVYGDMLDWILNFELEEKTKPSLVINNSWGFGHWRGMTHIQAIGIDRPEHPFNQQIQNLAEADVDILFAAGNEGESNGTIYGANSHPQSLCIGGVRTDNGKRLGYSSCGPGSLQDNKPDLCTYANFVGSMVEDSQIADAGTSTACAIASGVIAAIRTKYPQHILSPSRLRQILRETAQRPDSLNFDYAYGYGLINVEGVLAALQEQDFFPQL